MNSFVFYMNMVNIRLKQKKKKEELTHVTWVHNM